MQGDLEIITDTRPLASAERRPLHRVVLITETDGPLTEWPRETFGVIGDVLDVVDEAHRRAGRDRLAAVALETPQPGLAHAPGNGENRVMWTWLHGFDPIFPDDLENPAFQRMRACRDR
ncbi:hypothetical protein [Lapillicoccus jejuensis]|uniref:Uncharacterized protein n=1 Tax=Lapillicoccus jejuensis TaxID=402171 RepID=A0A542E616_9MICO|nr:hypothetical protein [Lapillicoccus jejuensis]TQJ10780.1 hypothetical protein FB458_3919 [Lapillicoccus jejuensis]